VLFLALLTERNDIAQFLRGKLSGHHKISPTVVSPNKTRAGFIGVVAATAPPT
jgi:predicted CDP-diglyceride synthetase/phosphatidate cytidylyltransferase